MKAATKVGIEHLERMARRARARRSIASAWLSPILGVLAGLSFGAAAVLLFFGVLISWGPFWTALGLGLFGVLLAVVDEALRSSRRREEPPGEPPTLELEE